MFWFWWNLIGFVVTFCIGFLGSKAISPEAALSEAPVLDEKPNFAIPQTWVLLVFFALILAISIGLPYLIG
jgi:hypothetical protein